MEINIVRIKYDGRENEGFKCDRPSGTQDYLFIHFKTPVVMECENGRMDVKPGGCILYKPNARHYFEAVGQQLIHDWVHFVPTDEATFDGFGFDYNQLFYPHKTSFITPLICDAEGDFINKPPMWQLQTSSLLTSLFVKLCREELDHSSVAMSRAMHQLLEVLNDIRVRLHGHCSEDWSVDRMANEAGLSRSRFQVLYKSFYGISPKNDLINARIDRAKYLLENHALSISEVSEMSGYNNMYHFIRQFKQHTGTTPGVFRGV